MSRKERDRMTIMTGVQRQELTLLQAGELMAVCYRQSKRIWRRYQADGDAGLVHRLRGQPSAQRKPPELRALVLARYAEECYADFGKRWWWITRRCGAGGWEVERVAQGDWATELVKPLYCFSRK